MPPLKHTQKCSPGTTMPLPVSIFSVSITALWTLLSWASADESRERFAGAGFDGDEKGVTRPGDGAAGSGERRADCASRSSSGDGWGAVAPALRTST